jgi:hypothetical protein
MRIVAGKVPKGAEPLLDEKNDLGRNRIERAVFVCLLESLHGSSLLAKERGSRPFFLSWPMLTPGNDNHIAGLDNTNAALLPNRIARPRYERREKMLERVGLLE